MGAIGVPKTIIRSVPLVLTGSAQRITSDVNINSDEFILVCGPSNSGVIYFAYELASGAVPSDITPTANAVSPAADALFALDRIPYPLPLSRFMKVQHLPYILKPLCVKGTANDLLWVIWPEMA